MQLDTLVWIAAQHLKGQDLVEWRHAGEWSASDRASESRTLRRLEERNLVVRYNMNGDRHRTTHVEITEAGLAIIKEKRLTAEVLTIAGVPSANGEVHDEF